jgi:hypothetical protein
MNPLLVLYEFTEAFYSMTSSLWNWFSTDIQLLGLTFSPFDVIFNWITLGAIIFAVFVKKLVPLS